MREQGIHFLYPSWTLAEMVSKRIRAVGAARSSLFLSLSREISSLPSFFCKGKTLFYYFQQLIIQVSAWQCAAVLCPMLLFPWLKEEKNHCQDRQGWIKTLKQNTWSHQPVLFLETRSDPTRIFLDRFYFPITMQVLGWVLLSLLRL